MNQKKGQREHTYIMTMLLPRTPIIYSYTQKAPYPTDRHGILGLNELLGSTDRKMTYPPATGQGPYQQTHMHKVMCTHL
jgi:hypothetical protein